MHTSPFLTFPLHVRSYPLCPRGKDRPFTGDKNHQQWLPDTVRPSEMQTCDRESLDHVEWRFQVFVIRPVSAVTLKAIIHLTQWRWTTASMAWPEGGRRASPCPI